VALHQDDEGRVPLECHVSQRADFDRVDDDPLMSNRFFRELTGAVQPGFDSLV
jgi:hypothetical protein